LINRPRHAQEYFRPILLAVLLVHLLLLFTRKELWQRPAEEAQERPLRVRVIEDELRKKRQIVQSEDPEESRTPQDSAFLSDKDRAFDRQRKAREVDSFEKAARGDGSVESSAQPKKSAKATKDLKLSDLAVREAQEDPFEAAAEEYASAKKGQRSGDPTGRAVSSTNDYLEEVPLGDLTELNTTEYKFYGFYHRIRQKLEQFWGRSIQETAEGLLRNGRNLAAGEDHITSLRITLSEDGEVLHVEVMGTSGVKELDDAAIESFNQAGPFPNPPKEMVSGGQVILEWGFVVKS
jgi:protein TonB